MTSAWDSACAAKSGAERSWTQPVPTESLGTSRRSTTGPSRGEHTAGRISSWPSSCTSSASRGNSTREHKTSAPRDHELPDGLHVATKYPLDGTVARVVRVDPDHTGWNALSAYSFRKIHVSRDDHGVHESRETPNLQVIGRAGQDLVDMGRSREDSLKRFDQLFRQVLVQKKYHSCVGTLLTESTAYATASSR